MTLDQNQLIEKISVTVAELQRGDNNASFLPEALPILKGLAFEVRDVFRLHSLEQIKPPLRAVAKAIAKLGDEGWQSPNALGFALRDNIPPIQAQRSNPQGKNPFAPLEL